VSACWYASQAALLGERLLVCLPIGGETRHADVGERVVEEFVHHSERHRGDVGPDAGRLHDVLGMAEAGGEHFGLVALHRIDLDDLGQQGEAVVGDVVDAAQEWRDEGGADPGSEDRLCRREDERHVDGDACIGQLGACTDPFTGHRHLDDDIVGDGGEILALSDHSVDGLIRHLGGHGARYEVRDHLDEVGEFEALFGGQRRVRRHAFEDSPALGGFEVGQVCGVEKQLQRCLQ